MILKINDSLSDNFIDVIADENGITIAMFIENADKKYEVHRIRIHNDDAAVLSAYLKAKVDYWEKDDKR